MAPRYISRPQNLESSSLFMRRCLTYFVSLAGSIGGLRFVRAMCTVSPRAGSMRSLTGFAEQIARRAGPLLPFAAIHWKLDHLPAAEREGLVEVQQPLYPVLPRRKCTEGCERVSERRPVDHRRLSRRERVDVDAEDLRRVVEVVHQVARLRHCRVEADADRVAGEVLGAPGLVGGDHQEHTAVERALPERRVDRDREAERRDGAGR